MSKNIFVNIFIIWIIFQLIVLGWAGIGVNNQVANRDLRLCESPKVTPHFIGMTIPLLVFVNTSSYDDEVKEICEGK